MNVRCLIGYCVFVSLGIAFQTLFLSWAAATQVPVALPPGPEYYLQESDLVIIGRVGEIRTIEVNVADLPNPIKRPRLQYHTDEPPGPFDQPLPVRYAAKATWERAALKAEGAKQIFAHVANVEVLKNVKVSDDTPTNILVVLAWATTKPALHSYLEQDQPTIANKHIPRQWSRLGRVAVFYLIRADRGKKGGGADEPASPIGLNVSYEMLEVPWPVADDEQAESVVADLKHFGARAKAYRKMRTLVDQYQRLDNQQLDELAALALSEADELGDPKWDENTRVATQSLATATRKGEATQKQWQYWMGMMEHRYIEMAAPDLEQRLRETAAEQEADAK